MGEEGEKNDKLSEFELRRMANLIAEDVVHLSLKPQPNYDLYHPDIVFEDRIRNKTFVGRPYYANQISLFKIVMHAKNAYWRIAVQSVAVDEEESSIDIKWSLGRIGFLRIFIYYIPKKLWRIKNMEEFAKEKGVTGGVSTYVLDKDSKVIKHILDLKEVDKDKAKAGDDRIQQLKNKMAKLKKEAVPQPALYKKLDKS